jgi:hypothetical protein
MVKDIIEIKMVQLMKEDGLIIKNKEWVKQ